MGRTKLTTDSSSRYTHFTWEQRLALQYHYNGNRNYQKIQSPTLLGKLFGKHESTIRRELKRGMVKHELSEEPFERWDYNAEYAHHDAVSNHSAKGPAIKLGADWVLVVLTKHTYVRKGYTNRYHKWVCGTKIRGGASICPSCNVPERALYQMTADILHTEQVTDELFDSKINQIIVSGDHELTFILTDGREEIRHWQDERNNTIYNRRRVYAAS